MDSVSREIREVVTPTAVTPSLVDLERSGSLEKSIRVVAIVLRFVQRRRRQARSSDTALRIRAELIVIKSTRDAHFSDEMKDNLAREKPIRKSKPNSYRLFLHKDGLLRARTRLTQGSHPTFVEMNPLVIADLSRLVTLLVLQHHRINAHLGSSTVLNSIRRRVWILRDRQLIRF